MSRTTRFILALIALVGALYGPPVYNRLSVLGVFPTSIPLSTTTAESSVRTIPGTTQCEDVHHHVRSGMLFTACQGEEQTRLDWFPPLGHFEGPERVPVDARRGGLVVVNPKTFTATRLTLEGFEGAFVTHGIDIIDDPSNPSAIYIHAVNHAPALPLPVSRTPKDIVASRIEVFHHVIGSNKATYVRSIRHPLIRTPNDIYSLAPGELLVTNDHAHRDGLMRFIEDVVSHPLGPKTTLVRVTFSLDSPAVDARVEMDGLHNCNGLGHGPDGQLLLVSAAGGVLHLGTTLTDPVTLHRSIPHPTTLDNPSFYASSFDHERGYLNAGLTHAAELAKTSRNATALNPSIVWYLPVNSTNPKVLFHDDGRRLRTASAAVIVDDAATRERWMFATGFLSAAMVAMRVEL